MKTQRRSVRAAAVAAAGACALAIAGILCPMPSGATCIPGARLAAGMHSDLQFVWAGHTYTYDLYVPGAYASTDKPLPLLIDAHGLDATKEDQELLSRWAMQAEESGFFVAWPQNDTTGNADPSVHSSWNGTKCCSTAYNQNYDDVGAMRQLVAEVSAKVNLDHRRLYFSGESNGGFLAHKVACEAADLFAAVVPVSADLSLPDAHASACAPIRPITVAIFRGYNDAGITAYCPNSFVGFPHAQAGFAAWAVACGCVGTPQVKKWSDSTAALDCFDSSKNATQTFRKCAGKQKVLLTSWDAGHASIYFDATTTATTAPNGGADVPVKAWKQIEKVKLPAPFYSDADGDGWADADDDCPYRRNASQRDSDDDCVGDACQ
jgi:polyhydroxybutyrate depolymerase